MRPLRRESSSFSLEDEEFNLTDDQGLRADGTTDAVPHNADSRPEALEVGGDPAKGREEASQASDVCFLGDEDKASMVMPPRKSIQLEESNVEKSADGEAEQEVGRPGRPPWNSETKPGLDERDQSQGCSEKASCSSRPSGKKEQKRKQRRVSVFRPAPNDSDQQRQQRRDESSQKQKSSRPERGSAEAPIPRIHQPAAAARERDPRGARRKPGWMRKIRSRVPRKPRLHRRTTSGVRPDGKDIGGRGSPRSAFSVLVRTFLMKGSFGNLAKASLAEGSCRRDWDTEILRIFIPRKYLRTAAAKARGLAATRKS
ncbi:RNA exonuclease 1 homolog [Ixodes scapularis]|uniref:RNA exonuclease 1 homolog n=1 Tax=Ixodes scapularis TaxID=6945 RepID=UPI001C38EEAC|nr:RNA exonuclease 1 homolog [Ixodes scapularis]